MGLALYSSQYNFYLQGKIICSCLSQHQSTKMRALLTRHAVLHLAFYFVLINLEESSMSKNRVPPPQSLQVHSLQLKQHNRILPKLNTTNSTLLLNIAVLNNPSIHDLVPAKFLEQNCRGKGNTPLNFYKIFITFP